MDSGWGIADREEAKAPALRAGGCDGGTCAQQPPDSPTDKRDWLDYARDILKNPNTALMNVDLQQSADSRLSGRLALTVGLMVVGFACISLSAPHLIQAPGPKTAYFAAVFVGVILGQCACLASPLLFSFSPACVHPFLWLAPCPCPACLHLFLWLAGSPSHSLPRIATPWSPLLSA